MPSVDRPGGAPLRYDTTAYDDAVYDAAYTEAWDAFLSQGEEASSRSWNGGMPDPAVEALALIEEASAMISGLAAQRFVRVDELRREALAGAKRPGGPGTEIVLRSLRLEIAGALRVTEYTAGGWIGQAEALVHRYPEVLSALSQGRITEQHAVILTDAVDGVEDEFRPDVAARGLALAEELPVGSFRRALRKLIDTVRVQTLPERHAEALTHRRVVVEPAADGMAWLTLFIPAVEAHAVFTRATGMAKTILAGNPDDTRTLDQTRADVLSDLLIDGQVTGHPDAVHGVRATVAVTVPALSLLSDEHAATEPAVVEGVGPIPIDRARELCGAAEGWMRVLTHPETGMVLSVGRDQYRPPASLRRLVRWRSGRCMAPGCGIPAERCEIDHQTAWEHGGPTELSNLAPLCTGHHTVKHHGGWTVTQLSDSGGVIEWTSPLGRRYLIEPERRTPVFRPEPEHEPAPF